MRPASSSAATSDADAVATPLEHERDHRARQSTMSATDATVSTMLFRNAVMMQAVAGVEHLLDVLAAAATPSAG